MGDESSSEQYEPTQNLRDRAARMTAERNKLIADMLQHARSHQAIAAKHAAEAAECEAQAEALGGIKAQTPKDEPVKPEFVFKRRGAMSFIHLLFAVLAGVVLIALGYAMGAP